MPPTENPEIGTLKQIPTSQTNLSSANIRRGHLKSQTVDTLLRILSICSVDSSHITQNSDKDDTHIGSETKDASFACANEIPNDMLHKKDMSIDETREILGTQHGELNDLSHGVDTNPLISIDMKNLNDDDFEGVEISGEFMDNMPENDKLLLDAKMAEFKDLIDIENDLSTDTTDKVGKCMVAVESNIKRNLVDYSEVAVHGKFRESDCAPICPERMLPLESSLKRSATKNQDLTSPMKGSYSEEERTNKKVKNSIDPTISPENLTLLGDHPEDASEEVNDAFANKDADNEKKKELVMTKESKARKKRKERIKRAEKNRKLGVKRLKIQPLIKEKKITYCRQYLKGRCHEGENCKFSHDTIPLTKSKPCCHFARHSCMKGDDCPYDHQLSKYPCNNHLSKGFCSRGSDCMFSHKVKPSEAFINAELKPEQSPSSQLGNSGSKKQINVEITKTPPERLSARPPNGISFLSQEKSPPESCSSAKVQDSKEITKTPPVTPRGINFLSFGKKPGLDNLNSRSSFKIGDGIRKSLLSNAEGEGSKSGRKQTNFDVSTDRWNSSEKPIRILPNMSIASRRSLQSTVTFAFDFVSGVKVNRSRNSSQKL